MVESLAHRFYRTCDDGSLFHDQDEQAQQQRDADMQRGLLELEPAGWTGSDGSVNPQEGKERIYDARF